MKVEDIKSDSISHGQWARFIFIAGRLCIDFTLTGGASGLRSEWERLHSPSDLADWFAESPLHVPDLQVSQAEFEMALLLREAVWNTTQAIRSDEIPNTHDIAIINRSTAYPDLPPQFDGALFKQTWQSPATATAALSNVARDAVDLFSGEQRSRIRECANPNCGLLYVDTSHPGNRRWCLMKRCGNMAKTKRYRNRSK